MVESDSLVVYTVLCLGDHLCSGTGVATVQSNPPPQKAFPCDIQQRKVLDIAIKEVSGALSMHTVPKAIWIVCGAHRSDSHVRAS
jgi:hypothetical protein